jgi:hypothetical protein
MGNGAAAARDGRRRLTCLESEFPTSRLVTNGDDDPDGRLRAVERRRAVGTRRQAPPTGRHTPGRSLESTRGHRASCGIPAAKRCCGATAGRILRSVLTASLHSLAAEHRCSPPGEVVIVANRNRRVSSGDPRPASNASTGSVMMARRQSRDVLPLRLVTGCDARVRRSGTLASTQRPRHLPAPPRSSQTRGVTVWPAASRHH